MVCYKSYITTEKLVFKNFQLRGFHLSVCILILYIIFKQFMTLQHLCSIFLSDIIWPHEETFHLVQTLHSGS